MRASGGQGLCPCTTLAVALALASCAPRKPPPPAPVASPHYTLGAAYEAAGHWFYPTESYELDRTGIAGVADPGTGLTADGELADASALTAAMQTIQLPAIARVTNLDNGLQIMVRVNGRGPADPARLIALSPRAAALLRIPAGGAARVRVQLDPELSHRVVEQVGGGPKLDMRTAPRAAVQAQDLPPPGRGGPGQSRTLGTDAARAEGRAVPDRLPEVVRRVPVFATAIYLDAGSFRRFEYANQRAARLSGIGADVVRSRDGRDESFTVRAGPFRSIGEADAAMAFALRAGIRDASLVIE